MPQSLTKNYLHIVFSTKYRQPLIHEPVQNELYNYIGGTCRELEYYPVQIGGYTDHMHILCILSKKIMFMQLLKEVKSSSSKWMKTKGDSLRNFYWQRGYGAFSVNPAQIDVVKAYIQNQKAHHEKKTFQDEYRYFLNKYNIEYDERYVWD